MTLTSREREAGRVIARANTVSGAPCFDGTRIPVAVVWGYARSGHSDAQIREAYPDLTDEDITTARAILQAAEDYRQWIDDSSPDGPLTDREREVAAEAARTLFADLLRENTTLSDELDYCLDQERLVKRQLSRALYGAEDDWPFLDDGVVGELVRVVGELLRLNGGPLEGSDDE